MKIGVVVNEGPYQHQSSDSAYLFCRAAIEAGAMLVFLGVGDDQRPYFAIDASGADVASEPGNAPFDARTLAPLLPPGEAAIVAEARSLIDWHARHGFCAQCGARTRVEAAGWVRRCPECRASHYPRSDPVTIMLAVHGEFGLLGRGRRRPGSRGHGGHPARGRGVGDLVWGGRAG